MATALQFCLQHIQELEDRLARLEMALSRAGIAISAPPKLKSVRAPVEESLPDVCENSSPLSSFPAIAIDDPKAIRTTLKVDPRAALEDNPRVFHRIRMLWFYPESEKVLNDLIIDDRGSRAGFSKDIMEELLFLASLARSVKMHPGFVKPLATKTAPDVWSESRKQRTPKRSASIDCVGQAGFGNGSSSSAPSFFK